MSLSNLTLDATKGIRNGLLAKNLPAYKIDGVFTPNTASYRQPITQSEYSIIDSPNNLINQSPFTSGLFILNNYSPNGGFLKKVTFSYPSDNQNLTPNQGEYNPNETVMDLLNEVYIDLGYNENVYGPDGGFSSMYFVSNEGRLNKIHTPYWEPPTFVPSSYSPSQVLLSENPTGDFGLLSQDSALARIGAKRLKSLFEERINTERVSNITNFVNTNYSITVGENLFLNASKDFTSRISDSYFPASPIPGDYFDENQKKGQQTNQTSKALRSINAATGGLLGPILNLKRNPSQIFLANTGSGQKSVLFRNIDLNQFQPDYSRYRGGVRGILGSIGRDILGLIGTVENGYYVGSSKKEPGNLTSPKNQVPINEFGKQVQAPVFGPTDLSILYEGNENKINFGLAGKQISEGGSVGGGLVWVSPKYKNNAGKKATPGGGVGGADQDYFQISSQIVKDQSTNINFKLGSILDETQRLIDSADKVTGKSKLKHVGNAINQVSKVFNDGYKEITRGSKVLSYVDNATGREQGIEYARVFTKDTPYYTYNDLQKKDGITTFGRRFNNSILDNTFNLNIAPMRGPNSTNLKEKDGQLVAKKYMFSIENLAWRNSSKKGSTWNDLPAYEKGPNGGRIMWFPPYDIKFSDTSTPSFQGTSFLGRPEPMYTYKETSRSGQLSWKIIVDHPSILNVIVRNQLKNSGKEKIQSIINSFFAGCMKYDIYELAKRFPTLPQSEISAIQQLLLNATNNDDVRNAITLISSGPDGNSQVSEPITGNTETDTNETVGLKPTQNNDTLESLKKSLSKRILRNLLTEDAYFDMIKENTPMIYDSLKEKLKYFSPTFHSTTPEGLNARLTFLNQCVRPGETIPIVRDGELTQPNAVNTSFGSPPILVLRIGDFYHTKIVPDSMAFSYEPLVLDQNPEGIGVQPMIVSVSMSFKIIGGMGIAKPVEELQNALSFNFYANTEIYDERSTITEDTSKIDSELFENLKQSGFFKPPVPEPEQTNLGGNTIGVIQDELNNEGTISYTEIMDELLSNTSTYFETVVNVLETVQKENNIGIVQILNKERNYNFGTIQKTEFNLGDVETIQIYGKSSNWEGLVDSLFDRVQTSINNNTNPIIDFLSKFFNVNDDSYPMRDVKNNMLDYISELSSSFKDSISVNVSDLAGLQEKYIQIIRKLNVVVNKTDGSINNNKVKIYNVSQRDFTTLVTDFIKLKNAMDDYVELLSGGENPIAFYESDTDFDLLKDKRFDTEEKIDFFVVMARILTDDTKKQEFIDTVLRDSLKTVKNPVNLLKKFTKITNDLAQLYKNELKDEQQVFNKIRKKNKYKNLTKGLNKIMYNKGVKRICEFTTIPNTSIQSQQETLIRDVYSTQNVNDDTTTFDGKIKFN
jgi:hypothetical protein